MPLTWDATKGAKGALRSLGRSRAWQAHPCGLRVTAEEGALLCNSVPSLAHEELRTDAGSWKAVLRLVQNKPGEDGCHVGRGLPEAPGTGRARPSRSCNVGITGACNCLNTRVSGITGTCGKWRTEIQGTQGSGSKTS